MAEDLWAPARARRTLLMGVDMIVVAFGAILLALALFPPGHYPPPLWRSEYLLAGALLFVGGALALRLLVLQGRKVGAVYGVKAAERAGLLPPSGRRPPEPGQDPRA